MNIAAVFAGQGAQTVGMGKDLYDAYSEARGFFARANSVLGCDIAKICFEGPMEELTKTSNCQPAIFVVSVAFFEALKSRSPNFKFTAAAGISLGEWTALYAAGVLTFEQAVRILEQRGRFMQEACDEQPSGMVSVMKLPIEKVREICDKTGATMANINSSEQVVLSGAKDAVADAGKLAGEMGGRAIGLKVAGAYHSPFMASAAVKLARVLAEEKFQKPMVPVFSNVSAEPHTDPDAIRSAMVAQVTSPVRWLDSVNNMKAAGVDTFVEFGPGATLSGLVKRILPDAKAMSVGSTAALDEAAAL